MRKVERSLTGVRHVRDAITAPLPHGVTGVSPQNGGVRLGFGIVLVLAGAALLLLTIANPVFDPARGLRFAVDEGTAAVELEEAGYYAVYLEAATCTTAAVELVRVGHGTVTLEGALDPSYTPYRYDGACAEPLGGVYLPEPGLWTARVGSTDGERLALYKGERLPMAVDWELLWVFLPALAIGGVLIAQGVAQHRRWREALDRLGEDSAR